MSGSHHYLPRFPPFGVGGAAWQTACPYHFAAKVKQSIILRLVPAIFVLFLSELAKRCLPKVALRRRRAPLASAGDDLFPFERAGYRCYVPLTLERNAGYDEERSELKTQATVAMKDTLDQLSLRYVLTGEPSRACFGFDGGRIDLRKNSRYRPFC